MIGFTPVDGTIHYMNQQQGRGLATGSCCFDSTQPLYLEGVNKLAVYGLCAFDSPICYCKRLRVVRQCHNNLSASSRSTTQTFGCNNERQ